MLWMHKNEESSIYRLGVLGIFRPKKTKIATAHASSGFQEGVTFFEDFEFHCFEARKSMTYGGYVRFGRKIPSTHVPKFLLVN